MKKAEEKKAKKMDLEEIARNENLAARLAFTTVLGVKPK